MGALSDRADVRDGRMWRRLASGRVDGGNLSGRSAGIDSDAPVAGGNPHGDEDVSRARRCRSTDRADAHGEAARSDALPPASESNLRDGSHLLPVGSHRGDAHPGNHDPSIDHPRHDGRRDQASRGPPPSDDPTARGPTRENPSGRVL